MCARGLRYTKYQQIQREGQPKFHGIQPNLTLGSATRFMITRQCAINNEIHC